jgi:hypothetical protein
VGRAIEINLVGNNGRGMSQVMGCVAALFDLWGSPREVDGERCRRYRRQVPQHRRIQAVEVDPRATRPVPLGDAIGPPIGRPPLAWAGWP